MPLMIYRAVKFAVTQSVSFTALLWCFSAAARAQSVPTPRVPGTVVFQSMNDPWPAARERWLDIDNNPYNAWLTSGIPNGQYSYATARVTLTFDRAPALPYFVGRLRASGLKPPRGSRGWGTRGDELSNERIGYAGRWWCDSQHAAQTNFDDAHFVNFYKNAAPGREHNIYGYQFMGDFITDARGNADLPISGRYAYHITWAGWQSGLRDVLFGTFPVQGAVQTGGFYGYGASAPSGSVTLYYEYEAGRPNPVTLPNGLYKTRFVLTEEAFHASTTLGGVWKSVLATEDYNAQGQSNSDADNDVTFTIGAHAPQNTGLTPLAAVTPPAKARFFTTTYRDQDNDLLYVYFMAGESPTSGLQCLYNAASNKLFLRDDANQKWLGGFAPGSANTVGNSRGRLHGTGTTVTRNGNDIIVRWQLSPRALWAGTTQPTSLTSRDQTALQSPRNVLGTWTISAS
jgi:hypothetical protein